jgi:hypothetical protein
MVSADPRESAMPRAACAHVVLRMDLEKAVITWVSRMAGRCSGLKLTPARMPIGCAGKLELESGLVDVANCRPVISLRFPALSWLGGMAHHIGVSEPCLPSGSTIDVQVPPMTSFQELPWKSTVEVP